MSVECRGDVTIIIEKPGGSPPEILIWTIGDDLIDGHIDKALDKVFAEQYARFKEGEEVILTGKADCDNILATISNL